MTNIPIDAVLNQPLYARSRVNRFQYPGGPSIGVTDPGQIIGRIYSYVVYNGSVYWMLDNIFGNQSFFVKHDPFALNLPNKQAILNDIAQKAEAKKLEDKGIIQYNIDKYLPYILGAGVVVMAAPSIIAAISSKKINGMAKSKKNNKTLLLVAAAGVAAYFLLNKKKRKAGTPIIENISEGFLPEYENQQAQPASTTVQTPVTIVDSFGNKNTVPAMQTVEVIPRGAGGGYIDYIGPFKTSYDYEQNMIAGYKKKRGNLGKIKTC